MFWNHAKKSTVAENENYVQENNNKIKHSILSGLFCTDKT